MANFFFFGGALLSNISACLGKRCGKNIVQSLEIQFSSSPAFTAVTNQGRKYYFCLSTHIEGYVSDNVRKTFNLEKKTYEIIIILILHIRKMN